MRRPAFRGTLWKCGLNHRFSYPTPAAAVKVLVTVPRRLCSSPQDWSAADPGPSGPLLNPVTAQRNPGGDRSRCVNHHTSDHHSRIPAQPAGLQPIPNPGIDSRTDHRHQRRRRPIDPAVPCHRPDRRHLSCPACPRSPRRTHAAPPGAARDQRRHPANHRQPARHEPLSARQAGIEARPIQRRILPRRGPGRRQTKSLRLDLGQEAQRDCTPTSSGKDERTGFKFR